jgi:solute carrier family 25 (mitochondrial 2-oxodicarboxylate transporter), member 21
MIGNLVKKPSQKTSELSFTQMFIAGSTGSLIQILLTIWWTYPLDVIRTRLSLSEKLSSDQQYKGIIDCYSKTIKKEGFFSLYKGVSPTIVVGTFYIGFQMSFYDIYKRIFNNLFSIDSRDQTFVVVSNLFSGALAGVTSQSITYPGDTLRRRCILFIYFLNLFYLF